MLDLSYLDDMEVRVKRTLYAAAVDRFQTSYARDRDGALYFFRSMLMTLGFTPFQIQAEITEHTPVVPLGEAMAAISLRAKSMTRTTAAAPSDAPRAAANPSDESTSATRGPLMSAQHPLDIPDCLLVRNRPPVSAEALQKVRQSARRQKREAKLRFDRPKTWSPEAQRILDEIEKTKREKAKARFATLRERHPARRGRR